MTPMASLLAGGHDGPGRSSCTEPPSPHTPAAPARVSRASGRAPPGRALQGAQSPRRRSTPAGHPRAGEADGHSRHELRTWHYERAGARTIGPVGLAPGTPPGSEPAADRRGRYPRRRLRGEAQSPSQRLAHHRGTSTDRQEAAALGLGPTLALGRLGTRRLAEGQTRCPPGRGPRSGEARPYPRGQADTLTRKRSLVQSQYRPLVRRLFSKVCPLAQLIKRAKLRADASRRCATRNHVRPRKPQLEAASSNIRPRPATRQASSTRKRSLVQSQFRPPDLPGRLSGCLPHSGPSVDYLPLAGATRKVRTAPDASAGQRS